MGIHRLGKTASEGGGIGFLINISIKTAITIEQQELNTNTETMWIRIYVKRKETLFIGLFYGKQENRNNNITLAEEFNTMERHLYQYTTNNQNNENWKWRTRCTQWGSQNNTKQKRLINLTNNLDLKILNKSPKCKGKWTRINTKNEKSIIDYALCTQALYTNINTIIIDEEDNYKPNGKSKTDHNSIIEITSTVKKKIDNYQWKINSNTNWTRFRETMQNNIVNNKPRYYEELGKIIIQTAIEETGLGLNSLIRKQKNYMEIENMKKKK